MLFLPSPAFLGKGILSHPPAPLPAPLLPGGVCHWPDSLPEPIRDVQGTWFFSEGRGATVKVQGLCKVQRLALPSL